MRDADHPAALQRGATQDPGAAIPVRCRGPQRKHSAVNALLRDWDADVDGTGEKARNVRAWHRAVAAAELHTAELKDKAWDDDAVAHVELLIDRVGYQPTAWERTTNSTPPRVMQPASRHALPVMQPASPAAAPKR